jgi:hypothetical protein
VVLDGTGIGILLRDCEIAVGIPWMRIAPNRIAGGYEHLKRALELDATDELARQKLLFAYFRLARICYRKPRLLIRTKTSRTSAKLKLCYTVFQMRMNVASGQ